MIGLKNINTNKFLEYFDINDFINFLEFVEKDIETEKETYLKSVEQFLEKILNNPPIYEKIKNKQKIKNFINEKFKLLAPSLLFLEGKYKEFLKEETKKDINTELKKLFSKYKTGEIDKNEFSNWLLLYENKEGISENLLEFIKNG